MCFIYVSIFKKMEENAKEFKLKAVLLSIQVIEEFMILREEVPHVLPTWKRPQFSKMIVSPILFLKTLF